jgi:hypothetical protein
MNGSSPSAASVPAWVPPAVAAWAPVWSTAGWAAAFVVDRCDTCWSTAAGWRGADAVSRSRVGFCRPRGT